MQKNSNCFVLVSLSISDLKFHFFCHEDTRTDDLTRISIRNYRITKRSGRTKVKLDFKTRG